MLTWFNIFIKLPSIQPHPTYLPTSKICRVGLYTELFYAIIPTLVPCFLQIYISLHLCNVFSLVLYTCLVTYNQSVLVVLIFWSFALCQTTIFFFLFPARIPIHKTFPCTQVTLSFSSSTTTTVATFSYLVLSKGTFTMCLLVEWVSSTRQKMIVSASIVYVTK